MLHITTLVLGWLNRNSGALRIIEALLRDVLMLAIIIVFLKIRKGIIRQAEVAEAQTQAAEAQTQAAVEASGFARRNSELVSIQIAHSIAPLLVAELVDWGEFRNYKLFNRGQGLAFQVCYWQGGLEVKNQKGFQTTMVRPSTLVPNASADISISPDWEVFTVWYKASDREERWTIVHKDRNKAQEHVVRKGLKELYLS